MKLHPLHSRFNALRDLLVDCYNVAVEVSRVMEVHNGEAGHVISSCLFIKILNCTRAELLLFEGNLLSEVYILLRHQIEAVFVLKACNEDKSFLKEYIQSDTLYRLKIGNVILHNQDDFNNNDKFEMGKIVRLKEELKTIVDENGIKEIKVEELARKAKLEAYYNTAYRLMSNIVHVGVKSLDDYLVVKDGKIKELAIYPYKEDIAKLYISAIELLLIAIECISTVFDIDIVQKRNSLSEKLRTVAKPYLPE